MADKKGGGIGRCGDMEVQGLVPSARPLPLPLPLHADADAAAELQEYSLLATIALA